MGSFPAVRERATRPISDSVTATAYDCDPLPLLGPLAGSASTFCKTSRNVSALSLTSSASSCLHRLRSVMTEVRSSGTRVPNLPRAVTAAARTGCDSRMTRLYTKRMNLLGVAVSGPLSPKR